MTENTNEGEALVHLLLLLLLHFFLILLLRLLLYMVTDQRGQIVIEVRHLLLLVINVREEKKIMELTEGNTSYFTCKNVRAF